MSVFVKNSAKYSTFVQTVTCPRLTLNVKLILTSYVNFILAFKCDLIVRYLKKKSLDNVKIQESNLIFYNVSRLMASLYK